MELPYKPLQRVYRIIGFMNLGLIDKILSLVNFEL